MPVFSPDATHVAYSITANWDIRRFRLADRNDELIYEGGAVATCWIPGTERFFFLDIPGQINVIDLATRNKSVVLSKKNARLVDAFLSPLGAWQEWPTCALQK